MLVYQDLSSGSQKPNHEDVFIEEDEAPASNDKKDGASVRTEIADSRTDETSKIEVKEDVVPDDTIHEVPVGKGLSRTVKLLKDRGILKEAHLERSDEFGRVLTPKEAFRLIHNFHGEGPGKTKIEKRMKQYKDDEQKLD